MDKTKVDILITIVNYHSENDLVKAVDSIIEHTPSSISYKLVIPDNSARWGGEGPEILKKLGEKYPEIDIVPMITNGGFGHAHNVGQKMYDATYAAIVNPDILLTDDAFTPLIKYMEDNPKCICAVPKLTDFEGNILAVYRKDPTVFDCFIRRFVPGMKKRKAEHTLQHMDYTKPFSLPFAQGSFLLIRKDWYDKQGGFDERYFVYMEDADLCREIND